jgi:CO dehydrogenase/acetyl-CoA synthase beta subunit
MFRASLCPSSGQQDRVLLRMVLCNGCAGCGCVELGRKLCALCEDSRSLISNFYLNTFRASLCPSSGQQDRVLLRMVFCTGCAGCGCVDLFTV